MRTDKNVFAGRAIGIGVTGSIAAYKAAEIVSYLHKQGARVTVLMTESAGKFITPLTLQTLSHNQVITDLFAQPQRSPDGIGNDNYACNPQHIALADKLDMLLIAPASGNIIGKIASGIADDSLTTLVMSMPPAKVVIAPAMNEKMYLNLIVQKNIAALKKAGYHFIEPEKGDLACGQGVGRLPGLDKIIESLKSKLGK